MGEANFYYFTCLKATGFSPNSPAVACI